MSGILSRFKRRQKKTSSEQMTGSGDSKTDLNAEDAANSKDGAGTGAMAEGSGEFKNSDGGGLYSGYSQENTESDSEEASGAGGSESSEPQSASTSRTEEQNQRIETLELELTAAQDKYLRTLAEFENFKKRSAKERSELLRYQGESLIVDLTKVVDELDLALQYKDGDAEKFRQGIELIYKNLCDVFAKWEIRPETSVGKDFDPNRHLAISKVPATEETRAGTVVSELKKVFYYKDKIIRFGEVVVAVDAQ